MMKHTIRILLIERNELIRYGLRRMLEPEEDMEVVGEYPSASEAFSEMIRLRQDIVLMGTSMLGMNWLEATHSLQRNSTSSGGAVIILGESEDYRTEALEAGAAGYLLQSITQTDLIKTIRQIYRTRQSLKERDDLGEEAVELVVSPPAHAAQLLRFMCQLAEVLNDDFGSIICTIGSWNRGTVTSIRLHSTTTSTLLITLANMADVEKVEEEPLATSTFSSFTKKFGLLPRPSPSSSKRIHVTLKEAGIASKEHVSVLD